MERDDADGIEIEEIELDLEEPNLEAAMQEALDAVEKAHGDEPEPSAAENGASPADRVPGDDADELTTLREEVAALRDRSIRTLADFDNFRKRVERERSQAERYAGMEVLVGLLAIVDNLERAVGAGGKPEDLRQGVELILRQLQDLLNSHGVEKVKAVGEVFDPAIHDAVSRIEGEGSAPTVAEEMLAGYVMKDRLLRPAMVVVAMPSDEGDGPETETESG